MNKDVDQFTRILNRTLDILLAKYPARTGLGIVLGLFFDFLFRLFEPSIKKWDWIDYAGAPWWGGLSIGILVIHIPTITSLFRAKSVGDEEIDKLLALIEAGNFSEEERRRRYRELVATIASRLSLNQPTKDKINEIDKITNSTTSKPSED